MIMMSLFVGMMIERGYRRCGCLWMCLRNDVGGLIRICAGVGLLGWVSAFMGLKPARCTLLIALGFDYVVFCTSYGFSINSFSFHTVDTLNSNFFWS